MDKYAGLDFLDEWASPKPSFHRLVRRFDRDAACSACRAGRIAPQLRARATYHAPVRIRLSARERSPSCSWRSCRLCSRHYLALWSSALVNMILFLSLGLLVRNSGQISLCHLAFAAVGAAAFGHFTSSFGLPWLLSFVLAALVAVPVGAIVAIPAVRLSQVSISHWPPLDSRSCSSRRLLQHRI